MKPNTTRTVAAFALASLVTPALAGPREQAYRLHSRLASVPPSPEVLAQMESLIMQGNGTAAALLAMDNSSFYSVTLKNWASPWTNQDETVRVPLNDYTATVIGMVRDNVPFDQILYGDIIYTGGTTAGVPAYSPENNDHYAALETQAVDLKAALVKNQQTILNPAIPDVAGAMTTRAFGEAYYEAGTNRAALRFTFMTYLCDDLEQMSDTSIPDFRVRRDVDRQPGGDAKVFRNKCAGCHAGMDALGGAFAHFDWDGKKVVYSQAVVQKYSQNSTTFPDGFVTLDDGWMNLWTEGQNARVGWGGAKTGNGVKEYGQMLAATEAFPLCMAKRAYSTVCLDDLKKVDGAMMKPLADDFKADGFNLKNLFAAVALQCMGE
jgi:hypothetical protein